MLVRVTPASAPALQAALQGDVTAQAAQRPLFGAVQRVSPVLLPGSLAKGDGAWHVYRLSVPDSVALQAALRAWQAHPGVVFAQPNYRYQLTGLAPLAADPLDEPGLDSLGHFRVTRITEAWRTTAGDARVMIGFIDTGLYFEHPEFAGQVAINPLEDLNGNGRLDPADLNGVDDDGNGYVDDVAGYDFVDRPWVVEAGDYHGVDPDASEDTAPGGGRGHGTNIAGILGAAANGEGIAGVAPAAKLLPIRAFGADGQAEDDDLAAAILYAAARGADVVNLSFGQIYYSPLLHSAIQYATEAGVLFVASGGNTGGDQPHYPSDYPEVVSVAWLNEAGDALASRATHGIGIDLGAPGSFVYTTVMPTTEDGDIYARRSGSSVAAPQVAGVAALLRSVNPDLSAAALRQALTGSATDIESEGWDHRTGAGRLHAASALLRAVPAEAVLATPGHNDGVATDELVITGTVIDPYFESYSLEYAMGTEDLIPGDWQPLQPKQLAQRWRDTLAVWDLRALPDAAYTIRLRVSLRNGRTLEDRRRLFVDRTAPTVQIQAGLVGMDGPVRAALLDVMTDDETYATLTLAGAAIPCAASDRQSRRHGLACPLPAAARGAAEVRISLENVAGLVTHRDTILTIPFHMGLGATEITQTVLSVPDGYLLPKATDFDQDGLPELVLNQYQEGWLGDTLGIYEWDGTDFRSVQRLVANVFPRDVGDSDGDGLLELLTQVGGATLLLEQSGARGYPDRAIYLDTTGLSNPFDPAAAFGARLLDADADGLGEIWVHNTREWRILEQRGAGYQEVARLENPTPVSGELGANAYQQPELAVGDFDGNGRLNVVTGDSDGDWLMYEAIGDDQYTVVATYTTDRYNAGQRFAVGNLEGDGLLDFITQDQNWTQTTSDHLQQPDLTRYHHWLDGDAARPSLSVGFTGPQGRHHGTLLLDLLGDERDEWVVVHAPYLYLFTQVGSQWSLIHVVPWATPEASHAGYRSAQLLGHDWDGDGKQELIVGHTDGHLQLLDGSPLTELPPQWQALTHVASDSLLLTWSSPLADSVVVYGRGEDGAFSRVATTVGEQLPVKLGEASAFMLRAWSEGILGPSSLVRTADPEAKPVVTEVDVLSRHALALTFSAPVLPGFAATAFRTEAGQVPHSYSLSPSRDEVLLFFDALSTGRHVLTWTDVQDVEGVFFEGDVSFEVEDQTFEVLTLLRWAFPEENALQLWFSSPLDASSVQTLAHYEVVPQGHVSRIDWRPEDPATVTLFIEGIPVGRAGREDSYLHIRNLIAADRTLLPDNQASVALTTTPHSLADAYVFPNPLPRSQQPTVTIAGLPSETEIRVYAPTGTLVRRFPPQPRTATLTWDLTRQSGEKVPSGIYLVYLEDQGGAVLIKKLLIID